MTLFIDGKHLYRPSLADINSTSSNSK